MKNYSEITRAIGVLCNQMRLCAEGFIRYKGLVVIDKEEAINNLDRLFENNMEAFHTLYDVSRGIFDYHLCPEANLILNIRNALHHRSHDLFDTLLKKVWLDGEGASFLGAEFLIARHPVKYDKSFVPMTHLVSLADVYDRLDPSRESKCLSVQGCRDPKARFLRISDGLGLHKVWSFSQDHRYPENQVYIDLVPIFNGAISKSFRGLVDAGVSFGCFDSQVYRDFFLNDCEIDFGVVDFFGWRFDDFQFDVGPALSPQDSWNFKGRK